MTYLDAKLSLLHEHICAAVHPLHGDIAFVMDVPKDHVSPPGTELALITVTAGYLDIPLISGDVQGGAYEPHVSCHAPSPNTKLPCIAPVHTTAPPSLWIVSLAVLNMMLPLLLVMWQKLDSTCTDMHNTA